MTILAFLLNLSAGVMLMLLGVRFVQTGMERALGPSLRLWLTRATRWRFSSAFAGTALAIALQSATATAILTAGFVTAGAVTALAGLLVVLGADLGSSLIIAVLSTRPDWLIPFLLGIGGWLFLKTELRGPRQTGRILLGVAFTLMSLGLISAATEPIRESDFIPALANYLERDFVTTFLLGVMLTFVMHSSVAALLLCITLVQGSVVPVSAGVSFLLGANFGAALLVVWLTRGAEITAKRVTLGNLLLRGASAILLLISLTQLSSARISSIFTHFPGRSELMLVIIHILFNAAVLLLGLAVAGPVTRFLSYAIKSRSLAAEPPRSVSALDLQNIHSTGAALASFTREVLRMGQTVEMMAREIIPLYESGDSSSIRATQTLDRDVNHSLAGVRNYASRLDVGTMTKDESRRVRDLINYAINLESAGDIIAKRLLVLAAAKQKEGIRFSEEGRAELVELHRCVMDNLSLAFNVLMTGDIEMARQLVEEKSRLSTLERKSRKKHLSRLRNGTSASILSSDMHLETLRGLKELNSQISSIAYPILARSGLLQETRLIPR